MSKILKVYKMSIIKLAIVIVELECQTSNNSFIGDKNKILLKILIKIRTYN